MAQPKTAHELELMEAVMQGNINRTKELLRSNNLELNEKRYFDYYLIIKALDKNLIDIAKLLINNGFRVYKKSKSNQERTVLHAAVESTVDTEFISTLIAKGASQDIFVSNRENKTPFHLAIDRNQLLTIKLFIFQFDMETLDRKNLLHYAAQQVKITLVTELIKKGLSLKRKNEENFTPFCVALRYDNIKIVHQLLSYYTVKNIKVNNYEDVAPVYIASMCGHLKLVKKYADSGLCINRPLMSSNESWSCLNHCSGLTLLHFAVKHIMLNVVKFLLSAGANICIQNKHGSTPLHIAFETKEQGIWKTWQQFDDNNLIIDLILKASMKVKSNPVNKNRLSHFHIACSRDEPTVIEHFLKFGAAINRATNLQCHLYQGFYTLHFAAKFRCRQTLELLLKNGADVKKTNFKKMTALHIAAQESCLDVVRLLLEYGADITSIDSYGNSPVHYAFKNKNYAIIDLLLLDHTKVHSNPINAEGLSHFHIACSRNNVDVVRRFIKNGVLIDNRVPAKVPIQSNNYDVSHIADWAGYSPLHFAACHNRAKIVQLLLDNGATVDIKDSKGYSPLHLACRYTYEMFGEFIKNTLCDFHKRGKVALQLKSVTDITEVFENYFNGFSKCTGKISWLTNRKNHLKIINSLLNYGSDVKCIDDHINHGNTPIFYAYAAVNDIKFALENNMDDCSEVLFNQIIKSLSKELYQRRKLILNKLLKVDMNWDKSRSHDTILHYICARRHADQQDVEILQLFLENGANAEFITESYPYKMLTPFHVAIEYTNENLMRTLLDYGANADCIYTHPSHNKRTPLLATTLKQIPWYVSANIMKILIDNGANVHARELDGRTPLHNVALQYDHYFCSILITLLIQAGADINIRDNWERTPLHLACLRQWQLSKCTKIPEFLLLYGADINVEDFQGNSVCCLVYEYFLKDLTISQRRDLSPERKQLIIVLQNHVMKMKVIGLPVSKKELSSHDKFDDFLPRTNQEKRELIDKYKAEVQSLRDTKINDYYSLCNVILKNENALSKLVKNSVFKSIIESNTSYQTYPNYGYLIHLKYRAGVVRAKLLPSAKSLLYDLISLHLPDTISDMIFNYFTNSELKESIQTVSTLLNSIKKSSGMQLRIRSTRKRQKIH